MIYQEIIDVINSLKKIAQDLELTAEKVWKLVTSITTKQRCSNQCLKEFMLNLKKLGVLNYRIPITEHEVTTKNLFQGEIIVDYDKYILAINEKFSRTDQFKQEQKSKFQLNSQEKTIHVFEFNLNGKFVQTVS